MAAALCSLRVQQPTFAGVAARRRPATAAAAFTQRLAGLCRSGRRPSSRVCAPIKAIAAPPEPPTTRQGEQGGHPHRPADSPDDIVIVSAVRTPSTRARKGGLKDTPPDDLVVAVLREALHRAGIKADEVGDVCLGSVFPPSSKRANEVRTALLLAGFPNSVPAYTVNRQCAAGLQAIANVAANIRAGYFDIGIAGGIEHLTKDPLDWKGSDNPRLLESQDAQDVGLTLGLTAENVAERFGVPREVQDHFAAASHAKAAAAQASGKFKEEIVAVEALSTDPKTGATRRVPVDADDGIRPDSTQDKLGALKPYFKKQGTVTVGNACQNTDCAAAVVLMRREDAQRRGLPVMATLRSFAAVGVPPGVMGTAPSVAIPKALARAGLSKDDVEVYELNEAFASQFAYCMRELGLPEDKVNPCGGAIALGHPAGATGARQTVTLLHELARRIRSSSSGSQSSGSLGSVDDKAPHYGVVSMCTGSGMGAAAVFESSSGSLNGSSLGSSSSMASTASQDRPAEASTASQDRPGEASVEAA
ncbi:hypothetical protein ABPG75_000409 [Micractinium tetrahymenae]